MVERAPRNTATLFIGDVTSRDGGRIPTTQSVPLGVTRDWSATGVFVQTIARPPSDSKVEFTFVWGDETVRSRARVARHAEDGIGLTFIEPSPTFTYAVTGILAESD